MKKHIYEILIIMIFLSLIAVLKSEELPKYIFQIPTYSGTELFRSEQPDLIEFRYPFANILKIYKTKDGSALNKNEVINFYEKYYKERGWKDGIFKRNGDDPYLSLMVDFYSPSKSEPEIHIAGYFYLWVSPKDGMYTVFMKQWRHVMLGQRTSDLIYNITQILPTVADESGYKIQKAEEWSGWEGYYQNEYLVEHILYTLFKNDSDQSRNDDPTRCFDLLILTYKNNEVAKVEAGRIKEKIGISIKGHTILIIDNIMLHFDDRFNKHEKAINKITTLIEKLVKQK
ncbi:MAG: hypothetical protein WC947_05350 [Elusimicrobiota bacterium]